MPAAATSTASDNPNSPSSGGALGENKSSGRAVKGERKRWQQFNMKPGHYLDGLDGVGSKNLIRSAVESETMKLGG